MSYTLYIYIFIILLFGWRSGRFLYSYCKSTITINFMIDFQSISAVSLLLTSITIECKNSNLTIHKAFVIIFIVPISLVLHKYREINNFIAYLIKNTNTMCVLYTQATSLMTKVFVNIDAVSQSGSSSYFLRFVCKCNLCGSYCY